jgi:hypothetical protein
MKEHFQKLKSVIPEKEKGEKEIKVELDPGEPNRPREENQPAAHLLQTRNGTLRWPSPSLTCGPHLPVVFNLRPFLSPATVSSNPRSPINSITPGINQRTPGGYK